MIAIGLKFVGVVLIALVCVGCGPDEDGDGNVSDKEFIAWCAENPGSCSSGPNQPPDNICWDCN